MSTRQHFAAGLHRNKQNKAVPPESVCPDLRCRCTAQWDVHPPPWLSHASHTCTHVTVPHFTHTNSGHTSQHPTLHTFQHWTHIMAPQFTHSDTGHTSQHPTLHTQTLHTCLTCLTQAWHTHDGITYTHLALHSNTC